MHVQRDRDVRGLSKRRMQCCIVTFTKVVHSVTKG